ncbi:MAG: dockerin [Chitinivibrionales bacterium]|nr:dockerin [Chitinivibrionales bacterium]MBD3394864.1 dockerin [Chitinivibrionales bacterium]
MHSILKSRYPQGKGGAMQYRWIFPVVLLFAAAAPAEIISDARRIRWAPGVPGGIPDVTGPVENVVIDHGAAADGTTDDLDAFQSAVDAITGEGVVFVPAGAYMLNGTLDMKSGVVLRGRGYDSTFLTFDLGGQSASCVEFVTYQRGEWVGITGGSDKGSTSLTVADGSSFSEGDFVEVQQPNDAYFMYTDPAWIQDWADNSVGQIATVASVDGNTITLDQALHIDFRQELAPVIRTQGFVTYAGVEYLHIEKVDANSDGSTFHFKNAAYCWVRAVESKHTRKCHVSCETAFACEFRDSYFHHSYDYGGGGHGYGVNLGRHATSCLTENNIFRHLRHSMLVQVGANGNVFGYNYSIENVQGTGETNLNQGWTPCDISMHGHYPFMNLFESNLVQEIDIADYWGPCGPGNTVFRNGVESEGIDVLDHSHTQNIVGNIVGSGENCIRVHSSVDDVLLHGNTEDGTVQWDAGIADHDLPESYYLLSKPSFLGDRPWPLFGPDAAGTHQLPAQDRYEDGDYVPSEPVRPLTPRVYRATPGDRRVRVYDLRGATVTVLPGGRALDAHTLHSRLRGLPSGVYVIRTVGPVNSRLPFVH